MANDRDYARRPQRSPRTQQPTQATTNASSAGNSTHQNGRGFLANAGPDFIAIASQMNELIGAGRTENRNDRSRSRGRLEDRSGGRAERGRSVRDRERPERAERTERPEINERPIQSDRAERPERQDRQERQDRALRRERSERIERPERQRIERPDSDRTEKSDRTAERLKETALPTPPSEDRAARRRDRTDAVSSPRRERARNELPPAPAKVSPLSDHSTGTNDSGYTTSKNVGSAEQSRNRKLEAAVAEKDAELQTLHSQIDDLKRQKSSDELNKQRRLQQEHQTEIAKLKTSYEKEIEKIRNESRQKLNAMDAEVGQRIKQAVANANRDTEAIIEQQKEISKAEFDTRLSQLKANMEQEKEGLKRDLQKIKSSLEIAEAELVSSKQNAFNDRERTKEKVSLLEEELRTTTAKFQASTKEWTSKHQAYEKNIEKYLAESDAYQKERDDARQKLTAKQNELYEIADSHEDEIRMLKQTQQEKIKELEITIDELRDDAAKIGAEKTQLETRIQEIEEQMQRQTEDLQQEKQRAVEAINQSIETQAVTSDQLERVQRLLEASQNELAVLRKSSEEYEDKILTLKQDLRKRDQQLEDAMNNGDSTSAMRRLLDQKNKEIDQSKSEVRKYLTEMTTLKQNVAMYQQALEEAQARAKRRERMTADDGLEEVDRMQVKLLELKTQQFQVMEEVDDLRHNESLLKAQIKQLENELELKR